MNIKGEQMTLTDEEMRNRLKRIYIDKCGGSGTFFYENPRAEKAAFILARWAEQKGKEEAICNCVGKTAQGNEPSKNIEDKRHGGKDMKIERAFARASKDTFTIPPIKELLGRYVGNGLGWIDPFCGYNSPAEITNDMNPQIPAKYHMEAREFAEILTGEFVGVLFDPPYSYRQVSEHYKIVGKKATALDTSFNFYARAMKPLANKIKLGGGRHFFWLEQQWLWKRSWI